MNLSGIGVSPGVVQGRVVTVHHVDVELPFAEPAEQDPARAHDEIRDALDAVATAMESRAARVADAEAKEVLNATAMIARDPAIADEISNQLRLGKGRLRALAGAIEHFAMLLNDLGGYMAERVTDLRDVHRRAHARLLGHVEPGMPELQSPAVLVAHDLAPADAAALNRDMVLAIVTEQGGPTSHTAILAAQLGIPAVVRCEGVIAAAPHTLGVDGSTGEITLDPDEAQTRELIDRSRRRARLQEQSKGPGRTRDGRHVELLANIGTFADAITAGGADVEGSGLFRTEFMYLGRQGAPSLETQTTCYRGVFQAFGDRKVVVRTLDAGADKPLGFASVGTDVNPALGMRGLRLQREIPGLLETQLEAIAAASAQSDADVWVMAPMIATVAEARWFADAARAAGLQQVGVMVEVPSAALRADRLLSTCDFASVGTNDLSQYLFAADRLQGRLASLLDAWQPALWQLTKHASDAAARAGKPMGMCGEAGGDPLLALVAVGAGISSLSMSLTKVPLVRASLAMHTQAQCEAMTEAVIDSLTPEDAHKAVLELADPAVAELLA
ncbi:MAG: phosphoenolpyruvate--protein phosphotransferase [Propionibacterium sp.]|nr:phosphoenolpyruvate--protein phosphotransferase [Propionibacterium sp.]